MNSKLIFSLGLLFLVNLSVFSQTQSSIDEKLLRAKELERSGNRVDAKATIDTLLQQYPDNIDVAIFDAQLIAYEGNHAESLSRLERLNKKSPRNFDILSVYIDVLRYNTEYDKSIAYCDTLLKYYPKNDYILKKKTTVMEDKNSLPVRFLEAKLLEKNGNRSEAKSKIQAINKDYPDSIETALFEAQLEAFDKNYDVSLKKFENIIKKDSTDYDVQSAYIDVLRWNGDYQKSIDNADKLLILHPKDENVLTQKAKALEIIERNNDALAVYEEIVKNNPENEEAKIAIENLKTKIQGNYLSVFYMNSFAKNMDPWHLGGIEVLRKTKYFPIRFQVSTAARFNEIGTQFESEVYPRINKKMSAHLGIGFSNNSILFPNWRSTLDIYRTLPNRFEAALGFRTVKYTGDINVIYAAYLGKYLDKYWFSYRSYFLNPTTESKLYITHQFQVRRYYTDPENYTNFSIYTGKVPADGLSSQNVTQQALGLNTTTVKLEQQIKINRLRLFKLAFIYDFEELNLTTTRNRYSIMGTLIKKF